MLTKNLLALKKITLGLAIGWTVLITILCLVSFNDLPKIEVSGLDKFVHFGFYFILFVLWGNYFSLKQNEIQIRQLILLVVLCFVYGILIEILQATLTKTRQADALDGLANLSGALLGFLGFIVIKKYKDKQR